MKQKALLLIALFFFLFFFISNVKATTIRLYNNETGWNGDTFIRSDESDTNFCVELNGWLQGESNAREERIFIKFDLRNTLPLGIVINSVDNFTFQHAGTVLTTGVWNLAILDQEIETCSLTYDSFQALNPTYTIVGSINTTKYSDQSNPVLNWTINSNFKTELQKWVNKNVTFYIYPTYSSAHFLMYNSTITTATGIRYILIINYSTVSSYWSYSDSSYCESPHTPLDVVTTFSCPSIIIPDDCSDIDVVNWVQFNLYPYNYGTSGDYLYLYGKNIDYWRNYNLSCSYGGGMKLYTAYYPNDFSAGDTITPEFNATVPTECNSSDRVSFFSLSTNTTMYCLRPQICEPSWFCYSNSYKAYRDDRCIVSGLTYCNVSCQNGECVSYESPLNVQFEYTISTTIKDLVKNSSIGLIAFMIIAVVGFGVTTMQIEQISRGSGKGWIVGLFVFVSVLCLGVYFEAIPLWIIIFMGIIGILLVSKDLWLQKR